MPTGGMIPECGSRTAPEKPGDMATEPVHQRKLHLGHFAFMRALIQGVDTRASWDRYLRMEGEHSDTATVRRTIAWLRDEFAAAARRWQRHGAARLVLVDVANAAQQAPALPSLADFVAQRGMHDFSEAEQLSAYHAEHGDAASRGSRRARLIGRQLETLRWLEGLIAEPPRGGDAVSAWLHPDLAARLDKANLTTLAALIDRINGLGPGWYRALPAIGTTKATRIVDWLRTHEATIGKSIGTDAMAPRATLSPTRLQAIVPPAMGIVPLEKLIVPDSLSGVDGLHRLPQQHCLITAGNDREAILAWVSAKRASSAKAMKAMKAPCRDGNPAEVALETLSAGAATLSHTQRAYLKEAERFFLWAIVQHKKALSSMTPDDCVAYRDFLADPQPASLWRGPRSRPRWSPLWRPFEGPLSASAQHRAIAALKSLYGFLASHGYLKGNPFAGLTLPEKRQAAKSARALSPAQWAFIRDEVNALPQTSANQRLTFALLLLHETGLRISEAVSARLSDLSGTSHADASGNTIEVWSLVAGKPGKKERAVPVSRIVLTQLRSYLDSRGLTAALAALPGETRLLGRAVDVTQRASWSPAARVPVDRLGGIGAATLHDQLKRFFGACAQKIRSTDPAGAQTLLKASAHWMRHAHGFQAIASGVEPGIVQQNMGHASPASTARYAVSDA